MSIMRPAMLSNPYHRGNTPDRHERIAKFEAKVRQDEELLQVIEWLDDTDLVCCCTPMPCHGDVILKIWDELNQ